MKKGLVVVLMLISALAYGQDTPYIKPVTHTVMAGAGYQFKQLKIDTSAVIKKLLVRDTAGFQGVTTVPLVADADSSNKVANTAWVKRNGGGGSSSATCGAYTGAVTWSGTGLTYNATSGTYCINDVTYTFAGDSVTLATADATNDRFDVIILTTTGIDVITGTPSATPQIPTIDPATQQYLTAVLVAAGSTTPSGVVQRIVWDENTGSPEWVLSSTGITANGDNATNVYSGAKSTDVGAFTAGDIVQYAGVSYPVTPYNTLKFFIRLKSIIATSASINLQFIYGGAVVSTQLRLGTLQGFDRTVINAYQLVSVKLTDIPIATDSISGLRFVTQGSNANGFYLDRISIDGGTSTGTTGTGLTDVFYSTDSLYKTVNGVNVFVGMRDANTQRFLDSLSAHNVRISTNTADILTKASQSALVDTAAAIRADIPYTPSLYLASNYIKALNDSTIYFDSSLVVTSVVGLTDSTFRVTKGDGTTNDVQVIGGAAGGGGGGGTPGGSDTEVQFNDAGALRGSVGLRYGKTAKALAIDGYTTTDTLYGTQTAGGNLLISTTPNATKGKISFGLLSAYDEVNTRLGIGTASPAYLVDLVKSTAGAERIAITNNNGGTTAQTLYQAGNGSGSFQASITGTGYTTTGLAVANTVYFQSNSAARLLFRAVGNSGSGINPSIFFSTQDAGTETERWRIDFATGNFSNTGAAGTEKLHITGNILLATAGNKIKIATGTNASVGTATLVGGTVTVSTTAALTASLIYVTVKVPGGTQGFLSVPTITNATSFVINSTSATETSTVNWWIIN